MPNRSTRSIRRLGLCRGRACHAGRPTGKPGSAGSRGNRLRGRRGADRSYISARGRANPQGRRGTWHISTRAIALARAILDFLLVGRRMLRRDLFGETPPVGGWKPDMAAGACATVMILTHAAKGSSAPGLRSGFALRRAGDDRALHSDWQLHAQRNASPDSGRGTARVGGTRPHVVDVRAPTARRSMQPRATSPGGWVRLRSAGRGFYLGSLSADRRGDGNADLVARKAGVKGCPAAT